MKASPGARPRGKGWRPRSSGTWAETAAGPRAAIRIATVRAFLLCGLALVPLLGLPHAGAAAQGRETAPGKALAIRHCAFCHVIGDHNKFGGIGSTPSFQLLASMKDGAESFETFFARLPHLSFVYLPDRTPPMGPPVSMPDVHITYEDVRAIAAFAITLKDPRLFD